MCMHTHQTLRHSPFPAGPSLCWPLVTGVLGMNKMMNGLTANTGEVDIALSTMLADGGRLIKVNNGAPS